MSYPLDRHLIAFACYRWIEISEPNFDNSLSIVGHCIEVKEKHTWSLFFLRR